MNAHGKLTCAALVCVVVLASCAGPRWRTYDGKAVSSEMLKTCSQYSFKLKQGEMKDSDLLQTAATLARDSCPREDWIKVAPLACIAADIGCSDVVMTEFETDD